MDDVKRGVEEYLQETALHGFKYLQFPNGNLFRLAWVRINLY